MQAGLVRPGATKSATAEDGPGQPVRGGGGRLFLGEATIKTYVGNILMKLRCRDRVQAVVAAYEAGLVEPGHTR